MSFDHRILKVVLSLVLFAACMGSVEAKEYRSDNGFTFTLPDAWSVDTKENRVVAQTSDNGLVVVCLGAKGDSAAAIKGKFMQGVKTSLKDVDASDSAPDKLRGMQWEGSYGTATCNGANCSFRVDVFGNDGNFLIVYSLFDDPTMGKHRDDFVALLGTIKPPR